MGFAGDPRADCVREVQKGCAASWLAEASDRETAVVVKARDVMGC